MHSSQHGPTLLRSTSTSAQTPAGRRATSAAEFTRRSVSRRPVTPASVQTRRARRQAAWEAPPFKAQRGALYKYIKNVKTASEGCVTDE